VLAVTALAVAGAAGGGASAAAAVAAPPVPGTISTVAGGVGGPARATNVPISDPCGVSVANGLLYIAANMTIRQVDSTDRLTTPVGTGAGAPLGDGGPAAVAELNNAAGVTVDGSGNLVISDLGNSVIRVGAKTTGTFYGQSTTAGDIYTVAGDGSAGFAGDGGPASSAELDQPTQIAIDASGNLVFAENGDNRIRVVAVTAGTFYGQAMTAGDIYTVAGDGSSAFSGDNGPATAAGLWAGGVAVDASGNLVIGDSLNQRVRVVAEGTATFYGQAMTAGDIYTVAGNGTAGFKDARPALKGELNYPTSVAVDAAGNLVIADTNNQRVRVVAATSGTFYNQPMAAGSIYTVAGHGNTGSVGDGGSATAAELASPAGLLLDASGNTLIADPGHNRVRVLAGTSGTFYGQAMTAGDIYTIAGTGAVGHSGDGGPASIATLDNPQAIAIDPAGNVLIADTHSNRVRVVAETSGTFYGQAMTAGFIYTVAGGGTAGVGNGIPATTATLGFANGVAVDPQGNLVISTSKQRVRVVAESTGTFYGQAMTAGDIYTAAGSGGVGFVGDGGKATKAHLYNPEAVSVDAQGNLVIADTGNQRIRVAAAATGTFYGQAMTAGDIYTVAGGGTSGSGPATSAELNNPWDATVDSSGNLVIADTGDGLVRVVAAATGTFYGQSMTAGFIYTVAGGGIGGGFSGDGGPATSAVLGGTEAAIADPAGDLVISDTGNNRVREVAG
jgi:hypothetical protein